MRSTNALLALVIVIAAVSAGCGDHSADYRPETPQQRAQEVTQRTEAAIKKIEADSTMPSQAKQIVIAQLRRTEEASKPVGVPTAQR